MSGVELPMSVDVQALRQPFMKKHCTLVTMPKDSITSYISTQDEIIERCSTP